MCISDQFNYRDIKMTAKKKHKIDYLMTCWNVKKVTGLKHVFFFLEKEKEIANIACIHHSSG